MARLILILLMVCFYTASSSQQLSKYKGLVAWWRLNENAGLKAHDFTRLTTKVGVGVIAGCTWTVKGTRGKALLWSGATADKVTIGKPYDLVASEMTASVWVYFTSIGQYRYMISDYNSGGTNAQFALQYTNANKFTFFWANGGTQYPNPVTASSTTSGSVGIWFHIVGVRRGSTGSWTSEIYVNGRLETSASTAGNPATQANAGNVTIGQPGDLVLGILPHNGCLQDVMLFNRALTATEIKNLYVEQYNYINH